MINEEIADIFEKMSRVLEFKGANRFRALAYERAARSLRDFDDDLSVLAGEGETRRDPRHRQGPRRKNPGVHQNTTHPSL